MIVRARTLFINITTHFTELYEIKLAPEMILVYIFKNNYNHFEN